MGIQVNSDNFVRAETDRMFGDIQRDAGGVNRLKHNRVPAPVDQQTVIRMNRDTLYSFAIVNLRSGATLTLPDAAGRYMSVMVVNNDHLIPTIYHDAGNYALTESAVGSQFAMIGVRILVDPNDAADVAEVCALQDRIAITAGASAEFDGPDYDVASLTKTRDALLSLASGLRSFDHMFGTREQIDPVRHLIGTAAGWGGLPTTEAAYVGVEPDVDGNSTLTLKDVPVEAFWSISVYNEQGYFEPNDDGVYTINSVTATPNPDGSHTVRFVTGEPTEPNSIPVPPKWNYLVRLYRPRASFFDGSWQLPKAVPTS